MTAAQRRALEMLAPQYLVEEGASALDFAVLFGRAAPVAVEIGFGNGDSLIELAARHPEVDYLGIEVYRPGVGSALLKLDRLAIHNVRVVAQDAVEVLARRIPLASLSALMVFFPDPWPKKRHHKRRLIQPDFVAAAARRLAVGGRLHLATDWRDYAEHMLATLAAEPLLRNTCDGFAPRPECRPPSKYERRGQALGHAVWDLTFERVR